MNKISILIILFITSSTTTQLLITLLDKKYNLSKKIFDATHAKLSLDFVSLVVHIIVVSIVLVVTGDTSFVFGIVLLGVFMAGTMVFSSHK